MVNKEYKFETLQVHAGQENPDPATGARAVPIYQTAAYVFSDSEQAAARFDLKIGGNIYTRMGNPTTEAFEKRMAALEGGTYALAAASGAAATVVAIQNIMGAGDHIVSARAIYGGTYNMLAYTLKSFGIETTFVDEDVKENFQKAIQPNTKAIFIESLGNPGCNVLDMQYIANVAHQNNIPLIVDNTFASPYLLRPIEHGADIVIHSATKFIGGHGTSIGGVIIEGGKFDWKASGKFPCLSQPDPTYHDVVFTEAAGIEGAFSLRARVVIMRDLGPCLSPFNSFMFLQGLETLSLRVERHVENTLKVVEFLSKHPAVALINHPSLPTSPYHGLYNKYFPNGAGSIFTIDIKGGKEAASRFVSKLKLFSLLANVADCKSLVIQPATTTHSQMTEAELKSVGITPGTVRLSIGIEHIDDIIGDLENALQ